MTHAEAKYFLIDMLRYIPEHRREKLLKLYLIQNNLYYD